MSVQYRTFGTRCTPRLRIYWGIKPWHDRRNWTMYVGQPTEIFLGSVGLAIDWVPLNRDWTPSSKQRWMRRD